ncbi:Outer membrane protein (porin) [Formivibrio citricus]|uniref:Outer membrane protein (Porin) n=1 Tax=Formivibrio citricus TaxID=83765 RepID=A0A1I5A1A8_9NEIS|nr:porin [Formivibrio citricus]SFN56123.1 Outer membrane protein (porin) [Formivibrio citricus]
MSRILAVAVASAFVVPSAMAEVTVYGSLRTFVEYAKISDNGTNDLTRTRLGPDGNSRLGFKGTDKLDNGLQLYWLVENRVQIGEPNAMNGFNSRDTYVGVRGNFGELQVGKQSDLGDSFPSAIAPAFTRWNANGADPYPFLVSGDSTRLNNAAKYSSPVFLGGLQALALYDFGAKTSTYNYYGYQASLIYKSPMFRLGAVYKRNDDTNVMGGTNVAGSSATGYAPTAAFAPEAFYKTYRLGGNLTPVEGVDISVLWNRYVRRASATATEVKQDSWGLGAGYKTGKHHFTTQYVKLNDRKDNGQSQSDTGAYTVIGQYKYSLSKQTSAILTLSRVKNDGQATYNLDHPSAQIGTINKGASITAIAAGIQTDF